MSINVDDIAPMTEGLVTVARNRTDDILTEYGRLMSVWGQRALHGKDGARLEQVPSLADLAAACYAQGVRDTVAVAATDADRRAEPQGGTP